MLKQFLRHNSDTAMKGKKFNSKSMKQYCRFLYNHIQTFKISASNGYFLNTSIINVFTRVQPNNSQQLTTTLNKSETKSNLFYIFVVKSLSVLLKT